MPKALVTGATGFLGLNVVAALLDAGWEVRAGASSAASPGLKYLARFPVETAIADVCKPDQLAPAAAGCDVVFHVAGDTSFWRRQRARQRAVNVTGSENVARACVAQGVGKLIFTSTHDVFGTDPAGAPVTEAARFTDFDGIGYWYVETKKEGEARARETAARGGVAFTSIYPGFMAGPFDHTLQFGRIILDIANGSLTGVPPGGSSFCHVADVARAHVAAAEREVADGEGYICAGENMSYAEAFALTARVVGRKPPGPVIPKPLLVAYSALAEMVSLATGRPPELNPGQARYMSAMQRSDSSKARRDLGYRITPFETAIRDAVAWYRAEGILPSSLD